MPSISAISAYVNSSTSRSQTASRKTSGSASSATCRSSRTVARSRICSGVSRAAGPPPSRRGLDARAVNLHRVACRVAPPVPPRVHQDRIQPRLQVRAWREPVRKPQRLDEGVLDQILGVGRFRVSRSAVAYSGSRNSRAWAATVSPPSRRRLSPSRPRNMTPSHNPRALPGIPGRVAERPDQQCWLVGPRRGPTVTNSSGHMW